jgi:hypothetical protein
LGFVLGLGLELGIFGFLGLDLDLVLGFFGSLGLCLVPKKTSTKLKPKNPKKPSSKPKTKLKRNSLLSNLKLALSTQLLQLMMQITHYTNNW